MELPRYDLDILRISLELHKRTPAAETEEIGIAKRARCTRCARRPRFANFSIGQMLRSLKNCMLKKASFAKNQFLQIYSILMFKLAVIQSQSEESVLSQHGATEDFRPNFLCPLLVNTTKSHWQPATWSAPVIILRRHSPRPQLASTTAGQLQAHDPGCSCNSAL